MYFKFKRAVLLATKYLCIALLMIMSVSVLAGVVWRYVLSLPLVWVEELALTCMVWVTFLGAALAYELNAHLVVDFMGELIRGKKIEPYIRTLTNILVAFMFVVMIRAGYIMIMQTRLTITAALNIPVAVLYASAFVGGILMTWLSCERVILSIRALITGKEIAFVPVIAPPYKADTASAGDSSNNKA